jgi:hypothetical protein
MRTSRARARKLPARAARARAGHDRRQQPAALFAVAPVREEPLRVALGATGHVVDRSFDEARGQELLSHDPAQVDVRARSSVLANDRASRSARGEPLRDVVAHLEAARLDVRPDGGQKIARASDLASHRLHPRADDVGHGALPSAVNGGDGARRTVGHENRNTIGDLDAARDARRLRHDDVGFLLVDGVPILDAADDGDVATVHLGHHVEAGGFHLERAGRDTHIGRQCLLVVSSGSEMKRVERPLRVPAAPREKCMPETGAVEQARAKNLGFHGRIVNPNPQRLHFPTSDPAGFPWTRAVLDQESSP